ncbi:MAG: hypothetical protein E7G47_10905 [Clostridium perfringens]|nr:hypothetical protein [Clostridium perfringens]
MDIKTGDKVIIQDFLTLQENVAEVLEVFKCLDSKEEEIIGSKFYKIRNLSKQGMDKIENGLICEQSVIGLVMDVPNKGITKERINK